MAPPNKEMQLRRTCQLYAYVLTTQGKEVPEHIQDGADALEYPVNCVMDLAKELVPLDSDTLNLILNKPNSQEASDLSSWWEMYKGYTPIDEFELKK